MYVGFMHLHNATRWVVLIAAVVAIALALRGLLGDRAYSRGSRISSLVFVISMDLQLVLGALLYWLSPLVRTALDDVGAAMGDGRLRFFFLEHALLMVLAVAAAHVGSVSARRASSDRARHARTALWFTASLVLVLLGIPWDRPLLPGLG
jgi:hypothetical protein